MLVMHTKNRWFGAIARNPQGRLGMVLGWEYNHDHDSKPHKFWGVGIKGGRWMCKQEPTWEADNIADYASRREDIARRWTNRS